VPCCGRRGGATMRLWPKLARSAIRTASSEAAPGGSGSGTSRLRAVCLAERPMTQLQGSTKGLNRSSDGLHEAGLCASPMNMCIPKTNSQNFVSSAASRKHIVLRHPDASCCAQTALLLLGHDGATAPGIDACWLYGRQVVWIMLDLRLESSPHKLTVHADDQLAAQVPDCCRC